jgi:DNA ligase D-like protein (predicted 3'-phosphoesterase)
MVTKKKDLKEYSRKRDFKKTTEPKPIKKKSNQSKLLFVVQKHNASHLHYDFRIEIDGVLKSWAIPKGPSTDADIKRLAVPTEDHPMDYAYFEGTIPKGEYGGGTVMVWDIGTYENMKDKSIKQCYKDGQIEINLKGKKLKGNYVLIRTNLGDKETWLFKKMHDKYASKEKDIIKTKNKSALTKRTTEQITKDSD